MTYPGDGVRDLMGYEDLVQEAMQGVMREALARVARSGFPGEHHLYIVFKTDFPGVVVPPRLLEKYPDEMTIVLQNRFWDLEVAQLGFSVLMSFGGVAERLFVPFAAVKTFFDPAVSFGLQFRVSDLEGEGFFDGAGFFENVAGAEKEGKAEADEPDAPPGHRAKIIDLDTFRRRGGR